MSMGALFGKRGPPVQGMRAFTAGEIPSRGFVGNTRKLRVEGAIRDGKGLCRPQTPFIIITRSSSPAEHSDLCSDTVSSSRAYMKYPLHRNTSEILLFLFLVKL